MERTALQKLVDWNSNKRKKPLIVWGARQVGKTYLIQELFAKKYYPNRYVYVDCKKEDEIRDFCSGTANAEKIIEYRENNGRFSDIEELKEISGIGDKTFEEMREYITV